ncbi:hypothetical protein ES708_00780 [subsurface metagenome]
MEIKYPDRGFFARTCLAPASRACKGKKAPAFQACRRDQICACRARMTYVPPIAPRRYSAV